MEFHFAGCGKPLVVSAEQENCFRCTAVLATVVDPELSHSRMSVHQRQTEQFTSRNRGKTKSTTSRRSSISKFASKHLDRTTHASFFQRREKTKSVQPVQTAGSSRSRGKTKEVPAGPSDGGNSKTRNDTVTVVDDDDKSPSHAIIIPDGDAVEPTPYDEDEESMLSPAIPLPMQHYRKHGMEEDVADQPQFKRIKDVFFSNDPSQLSNQAQVLAPDSDEEVTMMDC